MIKEPTNPGYHGKGLYPVGGCAWLVDPKDVNKLVPIGALGEIIFESRELALGYLNDTIKTAATFIEPPLWARRFNRETAHGCRYLRMGDLGRHEKDGSISIYGRADTQVKVCISYAATSPPTLLYLICNCLSPNFQLVDPRPASRVGRYRITSSRGSSTAFTGRGGSSEAFRRSRTTLSNGILSDCILAGK